MRRLSLLFAALWVLLPAAAFASGEIKATATASSTVYAVIETTSGTVWNGTSFAAYNDSNWSTYAVALTEQGSSQVYVGSMPSGISSAGRYSIVVFKQVGGSPAVSDTVLAQGALDWSGTALVTLQNFSTSGAVGSVTGNVGGNVAGSVASVTGAVGSVTGNVGGNVAGSVGSVTSAVVLPTGTGSGQINLSGGAVALQANQAVNASQIGGHNAALDSNNLLKTDPYYFGGQSVALDSNNVPYVDTQYWGNSSLPTIPSASQNATAVWNTTIDGSLKAIDWGYLSLAQLVGPYGVIYGTSQTNTYSDQESRTAETSNLTLNGSGQPTARSVTLGSHLP